MTKVRRDGGVRPDGRLHDEGRRRWLDVVVTAVSLSSFTWVCVDGSSSRILRGRTKKGTAMGWGWGAWKDDQSGGGGRAVGE